MATNGAARKRDAADFDIGAAAVLAVLPDPVLVIDPANRLIYANAAAEQFFESSSASLHGLSLAELFTEDSPLLTLIDTVRKTGHSVSEYGVQVEAPRLRPQTVTIQATPIAEDRAEVVVLLQQRSIADMMDRQLTHRNAARSVTAMAAMLAHEVKNPLSGIRGAAQLLEENASPPDRELTHLICDEADRICALVDRMEVFSDRRPIERAPVNIHEVLDRARLLAQNGFARHVRFVADYDPSLPPVDGNRDLLIQTFLNLVKNAAEAVPAQGGEIQLATAYQHGVRLAVPGSPERVHLPLVVSIIDNGDGVPEDLRAHLFDPFVTTKHNGTGLGLALVAKVVNDHGGVIEFDSQPRRTVFRVCLPMAGRNNNGAGAALREATA
jgi:two-component system, NtrC family, nitrogen regulation sensor histidine kinase GlnL